MPYSAKQLVSLACQISRVQSGMQSQVGQFLNMILADYAQTMDLDSIRKPFALSVSSANTGIGVTQSGYLLPTDYLRAVQVYYNVNGTIFDPDQMSLERYNQLFEGTGVADYPEWYATDISQNFVATYGAPGIFFWPPPAIALTVNILYRPQTADIITPETSSIIPWFPNQRVLLTDLCVEAMKLADDSRKVDFEREVEKRMRKYLIMDDDKENYAQRVKLDKELFRPRNNLKPTKLTSIF